MILLKYSKYNANYLKFLIINDIQVSKIQKLKNKVLIKDFIIINYYKNNKIIIKYNNMILYIFFYIIYTSLL